MPTPWTRADDAALAAAIAAEDHAAVIRLARRRAGLNQTELAHRFGCHPSMISRFEKARRRPRDPAMLRRLAELLDLPATAFGLHVRVASEQLPVRSPRVSTSPAEEDYMRRRTFLVATTGGLLGSGLTTNTAAAAEPDPAALLAHHLEPILLGPAAPAAPATASSLRRGLTAARAAFDRADYLTLARDLPPLARAAEATRAATGGGHDIAAEVYTLITRALIKLPASGLEWISADRASLAATRTSDPLLLAEAERVKASVCRRGKQHDRAQELVLAAVDHLDTGNRAAPQHLALYSVLMCTAGYGAARAGNRDLALDLLADASRTAARLTDHRALHGPLTANITSHQVSALHVLGDPAAALHYARTAGPFTGTSTERQGRYLVDLALVHHALDRPGPAYNALREAEHRASGEVHTRATARNLIRDLRDHRGANLPGIRELAARAHVA
ncbi:MULTISPECIES: helix-turn-helix transcriptional regulator [unclassified Amycolatopsis]|uniref:helix-turn-helix domain-containing protein n=1 Tax=unclassified Amycolatopsis TaxID=2618356 RepID=UPI0028752C1F|nr:MULTISPECIES: helix-turn-helix transcriptional regulator [unclassified Amycolatopsis]MDS0140546.1 helix-turn-helix transcriptional regulator [Amycolatopsis sp. 505]MDS0149196.1 helix-turn-helix transcriptional regulator [Amycolatopsis sp. CM201R]